MAPVSGSTSASRLATARAHDASQSGRTGSKSRRRHAAGGAGAGAADTPVRSRRAAKSKALTLAKLVAQGEITDKQKVKLEAALKEESINVLLGKGFQQVKLLVPLLKLENGSEILKNVAEYLTLVEETSDQLGVKDMSAGDIMRTFDPDNWENVKKTLMNTSVQTYLEKGKIGLDVVLQIAQSKDRRAILKGMDGLIKETEAALQLDLNELSFTQIHGFFTKERTNAEKAEVAVEVATKGANLALAILNFLDESDGNKDGKIACFGKVFTLPSCMRA